MSYTWANAEQTILKYDDGSTVVFIPVDDGNRDYQTYVSSGSVPGAYVPPVAPPTDDTLVVFDDLSPVATSGDYNDLLNKPAGTGAGSVTPVDMSTGGPSWDASGNLTMAGDGLFGGALGIGTATPLDDIHIHAASGSADIRFTDETSGTGATDGSKVGHDGTTLTAWNYEAGDVVIGTNNSEVLRVDSSGRILSNTLTAGEAKADDLTLSGTGNTGLTIRSGITSDGSIFFADSTSGTDQYTGSIVYSHDTNSMTFATNAGVERVTIASDGKVGIGASGADADALLTIKGSSDGGDNPSIRLKDGEDTREAFITNASGDLILANAGTDNVIKSSIKLLDSNVIALTTSGTEKARVDADGRLLVGKTSAGVDAALVQVDGNANSPLSLSGDTPATNYTSFALGGTPIGYVGGDGGALIATGAGSNFGIRSESEFFVATGGANERLRIDSAGNVGIGTTSPLQPLHVSSGDNNDSGEISIAIGGTIANGRTALITKDTSTPYDLKIRSSQDASFDTAIAFETRTNSEAMRIDSSGRLLVGTSSDTSAARFIVQGLSSDVNAQGVLDIRRGTRPSATDTEIGSIRFKSIAGDGRYAQISAYSDGASGSDSDTPGSLRFSTTPDGSSGATERMRIDSSGRLLVGTSSDSGNSKLIVRGGTSTNIGILDIQANIASTAIGQDNPAGYLRFKASDSGSSNYHLSYVACLLDGPSSNSSDIPGALTFGTSSDGSGSPTERLRIDSSGRLLVGTSSQSKDSTVVLEGSALSGSNNESGIWMQRGSSSPADGNALGRIVFSDNTGEGSAQIRAHRDGGTWSGSSKPGRLVFSTTADGASSPTERMRISNNGETTFYGTNSSVRIVIGGTTANSLFRADANMAGVHFSTTSWLPTDSNGAVVDNSINLGSSSMRMNTLYAGAGTINTSDANEKQQVRELSASEFAIAQGLKALVKAFKFNEAVESKGDQARIHIGVIAQDVDELFSQNGLNAADYGIWCSDTWYEVDGKAISDEGIPYTENAEGAVAKTRLGIRYEELLAFMIAAL